MQKIFSQRTNDHHQKPNHIPTNLLHEKNQQTIPRSNTTHQHPPPADLFLISQQNQINDTNK
jgi:hypothetical protein